MRTSQTLQTKEMSRVQRGRVKDNRDSDVEIENNGLFRQVLSFSLWMAFGVNISKLPQR